MANYLFEFTMRVSPGDGCDLPDNFEGAYVPCYAAGSDFEDAVRKGVAAITHLHYVFNDIHGNVREIPITSWCEYIGKVWPDFADRFPSQEELPSLVDKGVVLFGPFACF